jgi:hypothetical protein
MGEDLDIVGVDIGEGKDKSIATLFKIGEDGEYRPIAVCDSISFADSVQRSGYVGVESGEYTFSAKIVDVDDYALRVLFDLDFVRDMTNALLSYCVDTCGTRRKTTYRTIRRDCAKRNRHK